MNNRLQKSASEKRHYDVTILHLHFCCIKIWRGCATKVRIKSLQQNILIQQYPKNFLSDIHAT